MLGGFGLTENLQIQSRPLPSLYHKYTYVIGEWGYGGRRGGREGV